MKGRVTYPLVYIEWEDSYGCSPNWEDLKNCSAVPMVCRSVGWLVHDDQKCKVIVPHLNEPDHPNADLQGCGDMTIPTSAILRMAQLTLPKRKRS
jgi:hypothetical protein